MACLPGRVPFWSSRRYRMSVHLMYGVVQIPYCRIHFSAARREREEESGLRIAEESLEYALRN
jgi:hypothetical protein